MRIKHILIIGLLFIASCKGQCKLDPKISSYSEAISSVRGMSFSYTDAMDEGKSSWISAANYYSCDGSTGYMIIKTDGGAGEYIHDGVPKRVWKEFKKAESSGSYYNENIKGEYKLNLK